MACGDWRAAAKECKERGDKGRIEYVFISGSPVSSVGSVCEC